MGGGKLQKIDLVRRCIKKSIFFIRNFRDTSHRMKKVFHPMSNVYSYLCAKKAIVFLALLDLNYHELDLKKRPSPSDSVWYLLEWFIWSHCKTKMRTDYINDTNINPICCKECTNTQRFLIWGEILYNTDILVNSLAWAIGCQWC